MDEDLPSIRKPSRGEMLRSMNRDLLLGLMIPGPDRFEVRGWVRWLLGDPRQHVPRDAADRERLAAIQNLDAEGLDAVRRHALGAVSQERNGSDAASRGAAAHDHLMSYLLTQAHDGDSVRLAAFAADTDRLLQMLDIRPEQLDDPEFIAGFQEANRELADAVAARLAGG